MSLVDRWSFRAICGAIYMAVGLTGYSWLNGISKPRYDLMTALDHALPFWPWTIVVYLSYYLGVLLAVPLLTPARFMRVLRAMTLCMVVAWVFFYLTPAHYPRPALLDGGPWTPLFRWLYGYDDAGNTFPSLHVASCAVLGLGLQERPERRWWMAWTVAVCLSTLTTKQHFVADLVGGAMLAQAAWWLTGRHAP